MSSRPSSNGPRAATAARLRARRDEIKEAVIQRALAVAPPSGREEPGYLEELPTTILQIVEHALEAIEIGQERLGPTPVAAFLQATAAARNKVDLDVVIRRYATGYSTLIDFLYEEVRVSGEEVPFPSIQRELTFLFDRLVREVSDAYRQEASRTISSTRHRRLEQVRRLLAGDLLVTSGLDYDFSGSHLGLIARHHDAVGILRQLATTLDRRMLVVEVDETTSWAWLGGRRAFDSEELLQIRAADWPEGATVAAGAPSPEPRGWRLTHRQASKALSVAARRKEAFTAYADVAMATAILRDEDLVRYLEDSILEPLAGTRGGGKVLRETLRTYFESGQSVSSTASALEVSRQTVAARLRTVEGQLGRTIGSRQVEIEAALMLEALRG